MRLFVNCISPSSACACADSLQKHYLLAAVFGTALSQAQRPPGRPQAHYFKSYTD